MGKYPSYSGVPGAIRTLDPLLRRQLLCPTELQGHAKKRRAITSFFRFENLYGYLDNLDKYFYNYR